MIGGRREKVFGPGLTVPLDRNAKCRIAAYARAWSARNRQPRQHKGPITRAFLEVLQALLWSCHNSRSGCCFPSYGAIAAKGGCARSTVAEALKVLEWAGVLSWQHRISRVRERCTDLFGRVSWRWRVIRTSNASFFATRLLSPKFRGEHRIKIFLILYMRRHAIPKVRSNGPGEAAMPAVSLLVRCIASQQRRVLSRLRQHRTAQREDRYDDRAKPVTIPRLLNVRGEQQRDTPMRHKEAAAQRLRQAHAGRHLVARMIEILARGKWLPPPRRYEAAMPTEIPLDT